MKVAAQKMHWEEARQKVLAENIANIDTAGYRPQDLAPLDFKTLLGSSSSKVSLAPAGSGSSVGGSSGNVQTKKQKFAIQTLPAGTGLSLDEQLIKMNQNYTDHRMTTTIYQKNIEMLKLVLK